jgi:hypothetical protein
MLLGATQLWRLQRRCLEAAFPRQQLSCSLGTHKACITHLMKEDPQRACNLHRGGGHRLSESQFHSIRDVSTNALNQKTRVWQALQTHRECQGIGD